MRRYTFEEYVRFALHQLYKEDMSPNEALVYISLARVKCDSVYGIEVDLSHKAMQDITKLEYFNKLFQSLIEKKYVHQVDNNVYMLICDPECYTLAPVYKQESGQIMLKLC